jgi:hypothetical protein
MTFRYFIPKERACFEHPLFPAQKRGRPIDGLMGGLHHVPPPRETPLTSGTVESYRELWAGKGQSETANRII